MSAYRAAHPERFEQFDTEHVGHMAHLHNHDGEAELAPPSSHGNYSAAELVIFAAGMAHAKQVTEWKKAYTEHVTAALHPSDAAAEVKTQAKIHGAKTQAELDVFKAGFDHYTTIVAPYMTEHPDAFSAHSIAEYIFAHPERFNPFKP